MLFFFLWSCCGFCCGGFANHNIITEERDKDGRHMCWCHVVFHSHPAVGCTFTVCSTASCLNWQQCMYPFGNRYKKWLSQSHHLHAPLVHQGNNRLIQRLRSGPWVWITLSRGGWVSQSVDTGAPYTHFDSNSNSNKQRDKKQTLTPNTPVKTAVFRRHTQTQITSMYFPLRNVERRPMSPSQWLEEKSAPPICHFG